MKRIVALFIFLSVLLGIVSCKTISGFDSVVTSDISHTLTSYSDSADSGLETEKRITNFYSADEKLQVVPYDQISSNAKREFQNTTLDFVVALGTTYELRIKDRVNTEKDGANIKTIAMAVHVEELTSFSWTHRIHDDYSDGSTKDYLSREGFTFFIATVSKIIEINYETEYRRFDGDGLVGKRLGIVCGQFPFWYYDDDGNQVKVCGYKIGRDSYDQGYAPKPGKDIIINVSYVGDSSGHIGFDNHTSNDVLMSNKSTLEYYDSLKSSADNLSVDSVKRLYDRDSRDYIADLYGCVFCPSIDLNGNEICDREQLDNYLYSLDEYFRGKGGLEEPWCKGYYGTLMPPEINDILSDICI